MKNVSSCKVSKAPVMHACSSGDFLKTSQNTIGSLLRYLADIKRPPGIGSAELGDRRNNDELLQAKRHNDSTAIINHLVLVDCTKRMRKPDFVKFNTTIYKSIRTLTVSTYEYIKKIHSYPL